MLFKYSFKTGSNLNKTKLESSTWASKIFMQAIGLLIMHSTVTYLLLKEFSEKKLKNMFNWFFYTEQNMCDYSGLCGWVGYLLD